MNYPVMFLDQDNKTKLVSASFSYFLELVWEKNKFLLTKCDSYSRCNLPPLKRNELNCFIYIALCKKVAKQLNEVI